MKKEFLFDVEKPLGLNEFLRHALPKVLENGEASNSKIRRLIFSKNVFVQSGTGKGGDFFVCQNPSFALKKNARVKVFFDQEKFFYQKQNGDIKFELDSSRVLYEDEWIVVVNKPPHFPTEATFVQDRDNLRAAVVRYLHKKIGLEKNPPYCGIVHRLDRDTSGAILFSKQRAANAALFKAFDSSGVEEGGQGLVRGAKKSYAAICAPCPNAMNKNYKKGFRFSVQNYLGRVSPKSEAAKWGPLPKEKGGKYARTDFEILELKDGLVFVAAELLTGRTHQIRVHLSQSALPILGDGLYGGKEAERIFLHSKTLELFHPISGESLKIEAPLPQDFLDLL